MQLGEVAHQFSRSGLPCGTERQAQAPAQRSGQLRQPRGAGQHGVGLGVQQHGVVLLLDRTAADHVTHARVGSQGTQALLGGGAVIGIGHGQRIAIQVERVVTGALRAALGGVEDAGGVDGQQALQVKAVA